VYHSYRYGEVATADDPCKQRNSFERATTYPPRRRNFLSMPGSVPNVPFAAHDSHQSVPVIYRFTGNTCTVTDG
jgi:cytochrome c oxidase subunit 1